nr:hypothetical protein [Haemoproteus columbae]
MKYNYNIINIYFLNMNIYKYINKYKKFLVYNKNKKIKYNNYKKFILILKKLKYLNLLL